MRRLHGLYRAVTAGIALVVSTIAWPFAPDPMPIHWDLHGHPDAYAPRAVGLLLLPLVALLLPGIISRLSRKDELSPRTRGALETTLSATTTFLVVLHGMALEAAFTEGHVLRIALLPPMLSTLALLLGWALPRTSPNRWIGVRTRSTLRDETIWKLVHRFAGRAMVAAGLAGLLASFVASTPVALAMGLGGMIVAGLLPLPYAWALGRARGGEG